MIQIFPNTAADMKWHLREFRWAKLKTKISITKVPVSLQFRHRSLKFCSSLCISIMFSSSLNCCLFSTSFFSSNYIDFSKLQCPSVMIFKYVQQKLWCVRGKANSYCFSKLFYAIKPFMEQNWNLEMRDENITIISNIKSILVSKWIQP